MLTVFRKHPKVFVSKIGANYKPLKLRLKEDKPYRAKRRHKSPEQRAALQEAKTKMLKEGVIVKTEQSEYVFETVQVAKKGTTEFRNCVDLKPLNEILEYDTYPVADAEDQIIGFEGMKYFAHFDYCSGYWRLALDKDSQHLTAFFIENQLFNFTKEPFGLHVAPGWFQRAMDEMIGPELRARGVKAYLDDVSMGAKTWEEFIQLVDDFLTQIEKYNMKLQAKKCFVGFDKMELLGHIVDGEGIRPDPTKIKAITNARLPSNKKELKGFLAFCQWYGRYIPNYSYFASLLQELVKLQVSFVWTEAHTRNFYAILNILAQMVLLRHPDMSKPFQIRTDGCLNGIEFVLLQITEPVLFWSRALRTHEKNWAVTEIECLAIIEASKKCERYVGHGPVSVFTDHECLRFIMTAKDLSGRLARWSLFLSEYALRIIYVKGADNVDAKWMSRNSADKQSEGMQIMHPRNINLCLMEAIKHSGKDVVMDRKARKHLEHKVNGSSVITKSISSRKHWSRRGCKCNWE